ncbi:MAG: HAD-IA family hydrolase, partial [Pseudomonadota bacterium]
MRGAIFDLDGTLADTAADLLGSANVVLAEVGLPQLSLGEDRSVAGRGGREMIRRSQVRGGQDPDHASSVKMADNLYPRLLAVYEERISDQSRLYDGVTDCLDALVDAGWRIGVCTNKPERLARNLLDDLGILDRFGALLGADTLAVRKPDPEHFFETCRRIGSVVEQSVMIGDTLTDLSTARAAGRPCILTTFGFAAEPLAELDPDAIVGHYSEIAAALDALVPRVIT